MNNVWVKPLIGIALMLLTSSTHALEKTWLQPAFVSNAFIQVALRNEYSPGEKKVRKWNAPIRVYVEHQVADKALHKSLLEMHLRDLTAITGLSIETTSDKTQANVVWVFTQESNYQSEVKRLMGRQSANNLGSAVCKAGFKTRQSAIYYAAIVIPVDKAREHGKLVACIVEEVTQVLGLPNDSDQAYPSIFNDNSPEELLSPLDIVLLKLLYQPEIKAGMSEAEVKPVLNTLLTRFADNGTLSQSVDVATQTELFQFIGY
ncbi:DUF2927 domain-containing protein [Vibrio vulnificus]|uniref:DUF2927 domain-containing protein n=1 Tax=Vibrio vulnificus TaxID=672 RepID=A0AAW4H962_VIBVL|nr:DUF2927 domain-containing protein [Vibrio vulnificus]EGR0669358.1 DUF2927 domain-containing protein [Vibrio vulnificus]EGR1891520.1 DUF2927 domain-containing protein [Vibrio vulnificus]EHH2448173.1 DUF2927 domain-containing protein [Vibrio vulnificus]EID4417335.1 DUF2927 domain-containing protein [Vibrio vulnificus]EIZ4668868.1 DUF2927 domain-containing protein [Vibrio vulnificus]